MPGDVMATGNNTLGLSSTWLGTDLNAGDYSSGWVNWTYPIIHTCTCFHWPCTCRVETKKIRLKLSEIERLRAAAKKDAKLKAVLAKFTDLIEIEVDFE